MELIVNNDRKIGRNDPCHCGSGAKYKKCCLAQDEKRRIAIANFDPMSFRHEMESSLKKMVKIAENKDMTAEDLERHFLGRDLDTIDDEYDELAGCGAKASAEKILWEAMDAETCSKKVKLAKQALTLYPHLPDAWVILGEHSAGSPEEILPYFEKAVQAGKEDLGEHFLKQNEGYFWGLVETRPFMRAKAFLAQALWDLGREDEAIAHYQECLKLNPNDNQGLRDVVVPGLLAKDRVEEAAAILKRYNKDIGAMHAYNKALYLYKKHGAESKKASKQLVAAIVENPHIPKYLTGKKKLPEDSIGSYALGSLEEAIAYAENAAMAWQRIPGALEWLSHYA